MINAPIGILDSGLGGLTVWRSIKELMPYESTVYIADSKNIPYGEKPKEEILQLARKMVEFLLQKETKIVVVACNTITVSCLDLLRIEFPDVPIVGTVPVIKKAAEISKNKKIGIFSTTRTAESEYQKALIEIFAGNCEVISVGSDKIVPLIEKGQMHRKNMRDSLKRALSPFKDSAVDTLCLGCTHFPFIENEIKEIIGNDILMLEPSEAVARHTKNVLIKEGNLSGKAKAHYSFYTTGNKESFIKVAKRLLKTTIQAGHVEL